MKKPFFENEKDVVAYAQRVLNRKLLASVGNTRFEMLQRYIQQKYGYSDEKARIMVEQMSVYTEIFEEFFNYARIGKFYKKDRTKTKVCGYTAEVLNKDFGLSPLEAYNYLIYLKEEPNKALEDLKAGLARR